MKEFEKEDYIEALKELKELKENNDPAYLPLLRLLCWQCTEVMLLEGIVADLEKEQKKPEG